MLKVVNPATEEVVWEVPEHDAAEVERRLAAAVRAFDGWRGTASAERAEPMRRAAALLRERAERYARLMAEEMGKPIAAGRAEVEKCAWVCDFYARSEERRVGKECRSRGARDTEK